MALTFEVPRLRDNWRRAALVSLAALVVFGVVVALVRAGGTGTGTRSDSADMSSSSGAAERSLVGQVPTTIASAQAFDADAGGSTASAPPTALPSLVGPKIVRTADLQVRVERGSFASAIDRATTIAAGVGGYVSNTSTSSFARGQASGELTLRVPSDRFDDVRRALARLGALESIEIGGNDVGGQLVDLDARLKTLRAEEGSLDILLGNTRDIGQILQVRDRITALRTEIEQLAGQQAALKDQVALATVHVSLHEPTAKVVTTKAKADDGTAFGDSVRTAFNGMVAVVGGMVIVLGVALPFLVLALLALPFVLRYRRRGLQGT